MPKEPDGQWDLLSIHSGAMPQGHNLFEYDPPQVTPSPQVMPVQPSPQVPALSNPELHILLNQNWATWIKVALDLLQSFRERGDLWKKIVALWVCLEDSQDSASPKPLPTTSCSSQVRWWIG